MVVYRLYIYLKMRTVVSVCLLGCRALPWTRAFFTYMEAKVRGTFVWVARVPMYVCGRLRAGLWKIGSFDVPLSATGHIYFEQFQMCCESSWIHTRRAVEQWQKECTLHSGKMCNGPHSNMCALTEKLHIFF